MGWWPDEDESLTEAYGSVLELMKPLLHPHPQSSAPAAGGQIGANYVCPLTPGVAPRSYPLTFGLLGLDGPVRFLLWGLGGRRAGAQGSRHCRPGSYPTQLQMVPPASLAGSTNALWLCLYGLALGKAWRQRAGSWGHRAAVGGGQARKDSSPANPGC